MIVRDERVVDAVRQIGVGVSRDVRLVGVAEDRIEQDADLARLDQDAGVTEVAPADAAAVVRRVGRRRLVGEEGPADLGLAVLESQLTADPGPRARARLEPEQAVDALVVERPRQIDRAGRVEPRRAEHERPIVAGRDRQHHRLRRRIVEVAAVQERLDQPERRVVAEVVGELDVAAQDLGHLRIERRQRMPLRGRAQQLVEPDQRGRQLEQPRALGLDLVTQRFDLVDALAVVVDERTAHHLGIAHRGGVHLRRVDVGVHDLQMAIGDVARRGRRRDEMGPGVPAIEERLDLHVRLQIERYVVHGSGSVLSWRKTAGRRVSDRRRRARGPTTAPPRRV